MRMYCQYLMDKNREAVINTFIDHVASWIRGNSALFARVFQITNHKISGLAIKS